MGCPSECIIGKDLVFGVCTHDPDTGILANADSNPIYRVYEDITDVAILAAGMFQLADEGDTTGFYIGKIFLDDTANFQAGKIYTIFISATVDGNVGGITYSFTAVLSGIDLGTGANTITVTVTDGTSNLEGAKVRFTKGTESYLGLTNASGVVAFGLDNGTWAVAITLPGYTFTPTTLVVSATAAQAYAMTAVTIPASEPGMVSGWTYCYDEDGVVASAVVVTLVLLEFLDVPTWEDEGGVAGYAKARTGTSDAAGLVTFTNMFTGARYQIYSESGVPRTFTIADDATGSYKLPAIVRK